MDADRCDKKPAMKWEDRLLDYLRERRDGRLKE